MSLYSVCGCSVMWRTTRGRPTFPAGLWPVPSYSYTVWWQSQTHVNNLPKVVTWCGWTQLRRLNHYAYTTLPCHDDVKFHGRMYSISSQNNFSPCFLKWPTFWPTIVVIYSVTLQKCWRSAERDITSVCLQQFVQFHYLCQGGSVMPGVCFSVCLSVC